MKYIFFTDLRSSKIAEAQKTFLRECRAKNRSASFTEVQKVVPKERSVSLPKLQKVAPKGAQCKFSAQKSFQKECRAKYRQNTRRSAKSQREYRRNRRRRSSKDVLKRMQNLHRKISGKEILIVPKGTQRLCFSMGVSSALESFFASYHRIISHSITSYIISHQ
jgi:tRNA A37 N6-isopentenylltransferase MiaA